MRVTRYSRRLFGAGLALAVLALSPISAMAECSADYVGLASINEVSDRNKDQFIEVKILSADIHDSVYSEWSLDFCATNDKASNPSLDCSFNLPLSGADRSGEPWLVLRDEGLGNVNVDLAGMDIRLKDAAGRTIDYVQVDGGAGTDQIQDPACGADDLPYDNYVPAPGGQSGQFARRLPDGTGDWSLASGASDGKSTKNNTNDEDASGPSINVIGGGAFAGGNVLFRVTLPEGETASQDIVIQYQTEDRTATSPEDYAAKTGSVVLSAGRSDVGIPVTTVSDADPEVERFWLRVTDISFGVLASEIGIGEVWPTAVLGRLEVTAPPYASVCAPVTIDVAAYDNKGNLFSDYNGVVLLSTSSNHGRWSRGDVSGILSPEPDITDDGSASYQFVAEDGGDATFAFANTHADVLTLTVIDQETGISTTSDPITFAENALYIQSADPLGADLIAGRTHSYQVIMLKQDPDRGECDVAADYEGDIGLKAWLNRDGDDPGGPAPVLSSTETSVAVPDTQPSANNFDVVFESGIGSVTLNPPDVGRYTLNLLDDSSGFAQAHDGAPLPIISASSAAPWTARPFAIALEVPGNPQAEDASGPSFQAAGREFTLRVGGVLYDLADDIDADGVADEGANLMNNGFAPSFGRDGEQVALSAELLAPATGNNPGLGGPSLQASDFSGGVAAPVDFVFTEVGIIDILGAIEDGSYLGAGSARTDRITGVSGPVGRFVPHHFTAEVDDDGTIDMVCGGTGGFTYSGQDTGWAVTPAIQVVPRNLAGTETRNYLIGAFMRLLPEGVARTWPSTDDSVLLADDVTPYPVTFDTEVGEIAPRADGEPILYRYSGNDVIRYTKTPEAVVAPFSPSLLFDIENVVDQDGAVALTTGSGSVPLSLAPTATGEIYYGRRTLENVYGPETADQLLMPFYMDYFTGSGFRLNGADNCTTWVADSDLQDSEVYHSLSSRGDSGTFSNGGAEQLVLAPAGEPGEDQLVWKGLPVWQQHDWDGDGNLEGSPATATFGVYRGHDRIIYWREVTN